jgi:hypothetical protein
MIEFKYIESKWEDEKYKSCDCCDYPAPLHLFEEYPSRQNYLCEICSSTFFSKALNYPTQCSDAALYQSIAWTLNLLREELKNHEHTSIPQDTKK